jgi:RHS repeat-associated protein
LTEANYSNNDYYHYTYDAVGNRETQSKSVLGFVTNDTYVYDDANRLTSVNAVNYTWDNNGNLLNDGVNTYTYDSANRLKGMSNQSTVTSYQYNGLNDRLRETVNGSTTTFTMDLNAGLTQALGDGTKAYIYGNGRIAQVGTGTEYFLGDALGSVRQMTQGSGAITYAKAYDPYGVATSTAGSAQSMFGYTGEYTSNNLVYLRARMYAPGMGRFLARDTWNGIYSNPLTLNRWNYTSSNPINYTDPSGNFSVTCDLVAQNGWCYKQYNILGLFTITIPVSCDSQTPLQPWIYSTPTGTPQPPTTIQTPIPVTQQTTPTSTQTPKPTQTEKEPYCWQSYLGRVGELVQNRLQCDQQVRNISLMGEIFLVIAGNRVQVNLAQQECDWASSCDVVNILPPGKLEPGEYYESKTLGTVWYIYRGQNRLLWFQSKFGAVVR